MNLCESCKALECSFRKDGRLVHACHSHDPITIADLAAKDAYWQDRIVRERKENQDLYANGVLTAIAPLAERPCIGATHGTGFVLVGRVWHEESEVRKAAESLGLREPPAVVVPELTEEDLVRAGGPYCINDREPFQRGARWAEAFIRENARAIPADRVLGEAKPLSSAPKDRPILAFWECPAGRVFDVVKYHNGHFVNWIELIEYKDDEEHAFPYLPREAEWIELPSFDALRANQGGADHGAK